jgi:(4S)-4-hydroxy-5-phosphonooxypentane-2,3-dione isomerase
VEAGGEILRFTKCYASVVLASATFLHFMAFMIAINVILEIAPERVAEFLEIMCANAAASRAEPGCIRFEISRQFDKANVFSLSELYRDQDAVELHYATEHVARWKAAAATNLVLSRHAVRGEVIDGAA